MSDRTVLEVRHALADQGLAVDAEQRFGGAVHHQEPALIVLHHQRLGGVLQDGGQEAAAASRLLLGQHLGGDVAEDDQHPAHLAVMVAPGRAVQGDPVAGAVGPLDQLGLGRDLFAGHAPLMQIDLMDRVARPQVLRAASDDLVEGHSHVGEPCRAGRHEAVIPVHEHDRDRHGGDERLEAFQRPVRGRGAAGVRHAATLALADSHTRRPDPSWCFRRASYGRLKIPYGARIGPLRAARLRRRLHGAPDRFP